MAKLEEEILVQIGVNSVHPDGQTVEDHLEGLNGKFKVSLADLQTACEAMCQPNL